MNRKRARYIRGILRQGPTEAGYAFFRARRRRRNIADSELELTPSDRDALRLLRRYDLDAAALQENARAVAAARAAPPGDVGSITWLIPFFHLVYGGGPHTLLRFADHFAREHGVASRFHLYDRDEERVARGIAEKIAQAFPALAGAPVTTASRPPPAADVAIATTWDSAFALAALDTARAKLFFVQDFEPDFYPAGSMSALLGQVAGFGFPAIVNTPGLAESYRALGAPAVAFEPAVDTARYRPPAEPRASASGGPVRIFFYARPATPRNAFALGLQTLARVSERHGGGVEIVCAGEDWDPGQYGFADRLRNVGMLEDLDAVAELYRSCDIGLVFMLTHHPSYQPLEFMASGIATVSNANPHTAWLLRHEHNALLAPPLPALVAEQVSRLVQDPALRERIAAAGLAHVRGLDWSAQIEHVWGAITGAGPARFE